MPHLPFRPDNFASWTTPKLSPAIPTIAATTLSPNPSRGGNSNKLLYVGLGVLTVAVIATTVYLINQHNELNYQVSSISFEIKKLSALKAKEQTNKDLVTETKPKEDGTT
jgi:hypothetical protein